jgi:hypothetical protein
MVGSGSQDNHRKIPGRRQILRCACGSSGPARGACRGHAGFFPGSEINRSDLATNLSGAPGLRLRGHEPSGPSPGQRPSPPDSRLHHHEDTALMKKPHTSSPSLRSRCITTRSGLPRRIARETTGCSVRFDSAAFDRAALDFVIRNARVINPSTHTAPLGAQRFVPPGGLTEAEAYGLELPRGGGAPRRSRTPPGRKLRSGRDPYPPATPA